MRYETLKKRHKNEFWTPCPEVAEILLKIFSEPEKKPPKPFVTFSQAIRGGENAR